jgi:hypothetical protein
MIEDQVVGFDHLVAGKAGVCTAREACGWGRPAARAGSGIWWQALVQRICRVAVNHGV